MSDIVIEMRDISKLYFKNIVLDSINLNIQRGSIHGLLGLNGAGKTTVVKLLSGDILPDSGNIFINGQRVSFTGPSDSLKAGIATIHQQFSLIEKMTVAENMFIHIGMQKSKWYKATSFRTMANICKKILSELNIDLDPHSYVWNLGVGEKQLLQITIALAMNPSILIMDEPYTGLSTADIERFSKLFDNLKKDGLTILFVTHNIEEALRFCDEITVLKDGKVVLNMNTQSINTEALLDVFTKNEPLYKYPRISKVTHRTVLCADNISTNTGLENISFELKKGELLGVAGLLGSGRTLLARVLFGIDSISKGDLYLHGSKTSFRNPRDAIKHKIGLVPENRTAHSLIAKFPISHNLTLANYREIRKFGFLNLKLERDITKKFIRRFMIKTRTYDEKVQFLSSGNQQKTAISKWLFSNASILILDDPTQSIDTSTKVELYNFINKFTLEGGSILFISSDLSELAGMCDRVLIMECGKIAQTISKPDISYHKLLRIITKAKQ